MSRDHSVQNVPTARDSVALTDTFNKYLYTYCGLFRCCSFVVLLLLFSLFLFAFVGFFFFLGGGGLGGSLCVCACACVFGCCS